MRPFDRQSGMFLFCARAALVAGALTLASILGSGAARATTPCDVGSAALIWRDWSIDGVSASGAFNPEKSAIRLWGACVEAGLAPVNRANTWTAAQTFGDFTIYPTDTASIYNGQIVDHKTSWAPPAGNFNDWFKLQIDAVKVTGGTTADRWNASQHGFSAVFQADPANGMAGSHMIPFFGLSKIPAGLPDGGGTHANTNYQEAGVYAATGYVLSDGHYLEGIASYAHDNDGVTFAKAKISGFFSVMDKGKADNTYPYYGFQAYSSGTQQTTYAPDSAFRVDGGWRFGIDLRGSSYASTIDLILQNGHTITHDATNTYFGAGGTNTIFNSLGLSVAALLTRPATIATLPACIAGTFGLSAFVSDGTAFGVGGYGAAVGATGAVGRKVLCTNTGGASTYAWAYD